MVAQSPDQVSDNSEVAPSPSETSKSQPIRFPQMSNWQFAILMGGVGVAIVLLLFNYQAAQGFEKYLDLTRDEGFAEACTAVTALYEERAEELGIEQFSDYLLPPQSDIASPP